MNPKDKNLKKETKKATDDDFPSLHPGVAAVELNTWDQKSMKLHKESKKTKPLQDDFSTLVHNRPIEQNTELKQNSIENPTGILTFEQYLNLWNQYFKSPMIYDWKTNQYVYNPIVSLSTTLPEPSKEPKHTPIHKQPQVSREKQVSKGKGIQPNLNPENQKQQLKSNGTNVQSRVQHSALNNSVVLSERYTSSETSKSEPIKQYLPKIENLQKSKNSDERPLDKFALQIINRYKKELRKESSDTTVSDRQELKSEQDFQQIDMVEQIEKNYTILPFRLGHVFPKVIRGKFEPAFRQPYSTHYEYLKAKTFIPPIQKVKEIEWITLGQLRILNINLDLNIASRGFEYQNEDYHEDIYSGRKTKIYYGNVTDQQRAKQFIQIIKEAMLREVDFILLQQGYQSLIRSLLLKLIEDVSKSHFCKYFYPDNMENFQYNRTTLILSKHPVRFGQLQFEIVEYENQKPGKYYFPLQAFCEFEILVEKKVQRIGIVNCHLRSNGERNSRIAPWRMRQKQLDCIYDWGRRQKYDRYLVIGDTNMPSGQKFRSENIATDNKFMDAYDQGFTQMGGTYLYKNQRNQIMDERMDRVLMSRECGQNTVVQIQYRDVMLKGCEGMDKVEMLEGGENQLRYVTVSDHKIMEIGVYMVERKGKGRG